MVDERRQRLLGAQLRGLVGEHLGTSIDAEPNGFGAGAALVLDGVAWVLIDGAGDRRLGAALAWAVRNDASSMHVIAAEGGATLARRASGFSYPISVWFPEARTLLPIVAEPQPASPPPAESHLALTDLIERAGATPHVEFGVVTGEVRGLEVCRVVDEPTTGNFAELSDVPTVAPPPSADELASRVAARDADGVILEVGVGANDREAFQLLHGHIPTLEALAGVVAAVSDHRSLAARQHPLNRMAQERFLRWQVQQDPARLGLVSLEPLEPPVPRQSMKHAEPCAALGIEPNGSTTAVVFSSGVDLDAVPFVADLSLGLVDEVDRILIAALERDLLPITRDLAAHLARPVDIVMLAES